VGAGAVSVKRKVVAMAGVSLRRGMMGALAVATGGGGGRAAPNGGGGGGLSFPSDTPRLETGCGLSSSRKGSGADPFVIANHPDAGGRQLSSWGEGWHCNPMRPHAPSFNRRNR